MEQSILPMLKTSDDKNITIQYHQYFQIEDMISVHKKLLRKEKARIRMEKIEKMRLERLD